MATILTTDGGSKLYGLPAFPNGISPDLALAIDRYRAGFAIHDDTDAWVAAADAVNETEPRSLSDFAAKLIVAIHYRDPVKHEQTLAIDMPDASEDRRAVDMELRCLDALLACLPPAGERPELVGAFDAFQQAFLELKAAPADLSDADTASFYQRMDTAEVLLDNTPALTPAGVAMKLRHAFVGIVGEQWSDEVMRDEPSADFEESVQSAGVYVRMLWRAITDLRRMRGDARAPILPSGTLAWADALVAYEESTAAAVAVDSDRDEDAFDRAASAQGKAIDALLGTPAPDVAALATKLRVIHRDGYQHRLAVVLADAERLGEPQSDVGHVGWLIERNRLIGRLDGDVSDAESDAGAGELNRLDNRIIKTPAATTSDLFAKLLLGMQLLSEGHHLIEGDAAGIVEEARRIAGVGRASPFASRKVQEARS